MIILIADGYKNVKKDFLEKAEKLGIYDSEGVRPFFKQVEYR